MFSEMRKGLLAGSYVRFRQSFGHVLYGIYMCVSIFYLYIYIASEREVSFDANSGSLLSDMGVARNRGLSRSQPPSPVTNLCREPSVTNPCRGFLCRILRSPQACGKEGLPQHPPHSVTSLVAKRPPGHVTSRCF